MAFEVDGLVVEVSPVIQVSPTFAKREFVIQAGENENWPDFIKFELPGKYVSKADGLVAGDFVTVKFDITGRKYQDRRTGEDRYFTTLKAWHLVKIKKDDVPDVDDIDTDALSTEVPF